MSENLWFSDVFKEYRNITLSWNKLKLNTKIGVIHRPFPDFVRHFWGNGE